MARLATTSRAPVIRSGTAVPSTHRLRKEGMAMTIVEAPPGITGGVGRPLEPSWLLAGVYGPATLTPQIGGLRCAADTESGRSLRATVLDTKRWGASFARSSSTAPIQQGSVHSGDACSSGRFARKRTTSGWWRLTLTRPGTLHWCSSPFPRGRPRRTGCTSTSLQQVWIKPTSSTGLLALGAVQVDVNQGEQSWIVLADPEGNEFCLLHQRLD